MYQHTIQVDPSAYHHISLSAISQQHQSYMHPVSSHCLPLSIPYIHRQEPKNGRTRNGMGGTSVQHCPSVSAMVYHHPDSFVHCRILVSIRPRRSGRLCFYHIELSCPSHSFGCRRTLCTPSSISPYAMSSSSPTPLFNPILPFFYILFFTFIVPLTPYPLSLPPFTHLHSPPALYLLHVVVAFCS